ncbi:alpha-rhamnosidase [Prevotella sp. P5-126]|uniref:alpha-L-rhamnosidase-related protein n=1 Tax=Prevotella sp. P5-126 TaxID=2024216 RepID=UPI000B9606E7|nr:amylo-alpha-1,6-glucosidase [Prevotella sp. P5-126]OYP35587.1 alpha-rhamnosidase [Prevotella sp. P5-126]
MAMTSNPMPHATWIWYPGDFEVWLGNQFNNRRTERGAMFPPFWKQDSHWPTVEFSTTVELAEAETIHIKAEGLFNFMLDGKLQFGMPDEFLIPVGAHRLNFKVWNQSTPPALFIKGMTIHSNSSWLATYEDKIWIDENGVAHGSGIYVPAAQWNFDRMDTPPSAYRLPTLRQEPVAQESIGEGMLYDFGRETFGYVRLSGLVGVAHLYYGESREEALDKDHCETLDIVSPHQELGSKAFRYVYVKTADNSHYDSLSMDYEYAPYDESHSGTFACSDKLLNKIWEVGAYTMDLTTREFFLDGIKRDRWTWSGDAIQSYLMNYYLRFDTECVKRTIRQLRGKDPVTAHINTIMDYTFYWFKSILDYYQYTGDLTFISEMYPKMCTLMDYVLERTNSDGLVEGKADDWIFVDWVDFPMHKRGVLAFEQILFYKALMTMHTCATLLHQTDPYQQLAENVIDKTRKLLWNDDCQAWEHAIEEGEINHQITKFPNMFAILYDIVDDATKRNIVDSVMENNKIDPITTPYMRFYELEALCMMGRQTQVLQEIRNYWGGMLREGATSFWEKYIPSEQGTEHLAMYGRPYGKSLCHAWGASPVYLLGRYFLGIQPTQPGYATWEARPYLADLEWMEGRVPTPNGIIHIRMERHYVCIRSDEGRGRLYLGNRCFDIEPNTDYHIPITSV